MSKTDCVKVYYRGIDYFRCGCPFGPRFHPFMQDWNGKFHELRKQSGLISIASGTLEEMSRSTQIIMIRNPSLKPSELVTVDTQKFLEAIAEFKRKYEEKSYFSLNFRNNCIAFKNYILNESRVHFS